MDMKQKKSKSVDESKNGTPSQKENTPRRRKKGEWDDYPDVFVFPTDSSDLKLFAGRGGFFFVISGFFHRDKACWQQSDEAIQSDFCETVALSVAELSVRFFYCYSYPSLDSAERLQMFQSELKHILFYSKTIQKDV